jgi:hypothetical protein
MKKSSQPPQGRLIIISLCLSVLVTIVVVIALLLGWFGDSGDSEKNLLQDTEIAAIKSIIENVKHKNSVLGERYEELFNKVKNIGTQAPTAVKEKVKKEVEKIIQAELESLSSTAPQEAPKDAEIKNTPTVPEDISEPLTGSAQGGKPTKAPDEAAEPEATAAEAEAGQVEISQQGATGTSNAFAGGAVGF